ncbi:MAG: DUF2480 family protein [Bacteroidetes bacterium]|jgi:hypothetical protein|nr:MAG: DUF2480 family protein [Bacteroidota bacterium]
MSDEIINKVAQSPLITIDLKDFYPQPDEYASFDIADFLYEKLVLKEKDFRQALKDTDYSKYQNKYVCIFCSEDVIIPQWSYLLAAVHLYPYAKKIFYGNENEMIQKIICDKINEMNVEPFKDRPIVIKGCSDVKIEIDAYVLLIQKLMMVAKSVMYGEPCSTVPLFKKK